MESSGGVSARNGIRPGYHPAGDQSGGPDGRPLPSIHANKSLEPLTMWFLRGPLGRRMLAGRTRRNIATQLNSGVTTLRSVGDVAYEVVAERDAIERGERIGSRYRPPPASPMRCGSVTPGSPK
ncbi:hypothetical protein [Nocardia cyriacigeorgica]|uniref:hypothetical protein n=1 Tax=Nocardia cyriacigeorgica TaxID=135487 RepID=UPI0024546D78|nr:hypothetical protein [Nocardia cyriacigeorgica]